MVTFVFFVIALAAGLIPVFGSLVLMLVMPVFLGGIYRMAAGAPVEVRGLFAIFTDTAKRTPLMVTGVILLGASMVLSLTFGLALMGSLPGHLLKGPEPDPQQLVDALMNAHTLLLMAMVLVVQMFLSFGFFFAVALVTFEGQAPMAAFVAGMRAAVRSALPLLAFGLIYVVLAFLAAVPMGMGFAVLVPVTFLAGYCAYRDVFGAGDEGRLTA